MLKPFEMQQNKIEILSTRLLKSELVQKARQNGIYADAVAFIQNSPDVKPETAEKIKELTAQNIVAVFTSVHAVEVVRAELFGVVPEWRIFCTGGATKEALLEFLPEQQIIATAKNASSLADKILVHEDVKEVYFFCSRQRLNDLPETLRAAKVYVHELMVYQTIGTPAAIEKEYKAILFFSPSGVHSFFALNTIPIDTILFSIGKTTTATIESYCGNEVITSQWPGEANLIELVIDHFKSKTSKPVHEE